MLKLCPNIRMLMTSTDVVPDRLTVARVRCKKWTCPVCAQRNLNQWRAHLAKQFRKKFEGSKWVFLTITVPPHLHSDPVATVTRLQEVWKRMYDIMRRYYERKISYVYMYEAHQSGAYHIHALLDLGEVYDKHPLAYVWQKPLEHHPMYRWFKDTLPTVRAGFICDVRRIYGRGGGSDAMGAVAYAISYMAKGGTWDKFKKHARRIGVSQDIGGLPKSPKSGHQWRPVPHLEEKVLRQHSEVYDTALGRAITKADFDHGYYPPEDIIE